MEPLQIEMPDGSVKQVQPPPEFYELDEAGQAAALDDFQREMRIDWQQNRRAGEVEARQSQLDNPQTLDDKVAGFINKARGFIPFSGAVGDELAHGYTLGLTDHIAAGGTYLDEEMAGMPYGDRLELARREGDANLEEADIGRLGQLGLNMAGMVLNPVSAIGAGQKGWQAYATAAGTGSGIGAAEGLLGSDWESPQDVVIDTATGAAVGTVADLAGQGITDFAGGALRVLVGSGSQDPALVSQAFRDLNLRPTADVMGGPPMRMIGNAAADTPGWSQGSQLADSFLPGRSSAGAHADQIAGFDRQFGEVANPNAVNVDDVPTRFGPYAESVARDTDLRLGDEVRALEGDMDTVIPPNTATPIPRTEAVPDRLRGGGSSTDVAIAPAEAQISRIQKDVAPRDVGGAQNRQWLDEVEVELEQVNRQIKAITDSGAHRQDAEVNQQLNRLTQSKKDLETGIEMLTQNARQMEGAPIKAVREVRSDLGQELAGTQGVKQAEKKMIYGAMTEDMLETMRREGGEEAATQFNEMMAREQKIFDNRALIKGMTDEGNAAANTSKVRSMLTRGNERELAALTDGMPEEALDEFRAKAIYMLGDKNGVLNGTEFAKNWRAAGPDNQAFLVPDVEQRAMMDSLATVAKAMQERGKFGNHSNTSRFEEIMRLVRSGGAAAATAGASSVAGLPGVLGAIATFAGVDRVIASEALAKAVAGEATQLSKIVEQAILAGAVQGDAAEVERND